MKKKGLIISTVVMVVVLIASLTTATYAWFTTSSVTTINGFDVSVVSNNAVNIGIKKDYTHVASSSVSPDAFVTGDLTFTNNTAGTIGSGEWDGTAGLSAALNPNIIWGEQNSAFGILKAGTEFSGPSIDTAKNNVTDWTKESVVNGATAVAGTQNQKDKGKITIEKAYANHGEAKGDTYESGDYVHFILGVSPTKDLTANNFVIVIEPTGTASSLGVLASIHVAYRITKDGSTTSDWTDVDLYGAANNGNTLKGQVEGNVSNGGILFDTDLTDAYKASYDNAIPQTGAIALVINGLDMSKDKITQLEIVIYMSGTDPDCNDQGKTSQGKINMFFQTKVDGE